MEINRRPRTLGVTIPQPPRTPTIAPGTNKLVAIGTLVVALANAPAIVSLATPKPSPPPPALREDVEALRVEIRSLRLTIDELRKENDARLRAVERATDRLELIRNSKQ